MACLLPSVIDAVDVVDAVDADSVDDVLWIPRVERLRRAGATIDLPTGVACHTATSLLLIHFTLFQLFANFCVSYLLQLCGETLFANFPSCCFICRPGHGCVPARAAAK